MIATSALLVRRWVSATRLMRRALAPVIVVSLVRVATVAVFLSVGMGIIARTISLWAVPVGILLGLLLGRLYTARALHRLVTGLRQPPSNAVFRDVMADALEDPSLRIGFWHRASQSWLAMRMKVSVMQRLMDNNPQRARDLMREMDGDIEAALTEMRSLAHGDLPGLLQDHGLAPALRDLAARAPLPVRCEIRNSTSAITPTAAAHAVDSSTQSIGRLPPAIERAVYFCCAEAIQNAAKHAGSSASVTLSLRLSLVGDIQELRFQIADNGIGIGTSAQRGDGRGMSNMRLRIESVGGTLEVTAPTGGGVIVAGRVPV
jgi:signal transduction histidine kinase